MTDQQRTIDRLRALPTAAVSDALDANELPGSLFGISRRSTDEVMAGRAFTVRYEVIREEGGTVGDFLDDVAPGDIVVIDNEGRTECTTWGGIMSRAAAAKGIAGTVVNGSCRDVAVAEEYDYPIWSAGVFMRTGKDRVRCAEVQGTLYIDGVRIEPGDYVLADADGVVAVPAAVIDKVLQLAERIVVAEDEIDAAVVAGSTLLDAREQMAYHSLQNPVSL